MILLISRQHNIWIIWCRNQNKHIEHRVGERTEIHRSLKRPLENSLAHHTEIDDVDSEKYHNRNWIFNHQEVASAIGAQYIYRDNQVKGSNQCCNPRIVRHYSHSNDTINNRDHCEYNRDPLIPQFVAFELTELRFHPIKILHDTEQHDSQNIGVILIEFKPG